MRLTTGCRVHLGLLDLNGGLGRVDGGIGIGLNEPGIEATANHSDQLSVTGPLSERVQMGAQLMIDYINGTPADVTVEKGIPQHVGLGSGTQAMLAGAAIIAQLNNHDLTTRDLAEITGRGGTSGIGTAAFDSGGFILDGGHNFDQKEDFLPSSAADTPPPPIISRLQFPDWEMKLIIPEGEGSYGSDELDVFAEECPIPADEVAKICRIVLMKLIPAVKQAQFVDFRDSLAEIQKIGFKYREISRQPISKQLIKYLHDCGYAAGMSSFGPAVLAVHPNSVDSISTRHKSHRTSPDSTGAIFSTNI